MNECPLAKTASLNLSGVEWSGMYIVVGSFGGGH